MGLDLFGHLGNTAAGLLNNQQMQEWLYAAQRDTQTFNGAYTYATSSTGACGTAVAADADAVAAQRVGIAQRPSQHPDLAWLDQRVDEMRVRL